MAIDALEYLQPSPLVSSSPELAQFIAALKKPEGSLKAICDHLIGTVIAALAYEKKVTTARTPVGEALRLGRGVCQDFAHLFLAACRGIGLPARYVSGYVHEEGEVATHAWCQVWTGKTGWLDVDPTRGTFGGDDYIKIAVGRDYSDVPPNRGVWKGQGEETISVSVKVEPIDRVPADWSDWSANQAPWSASSWVQSQSRLERARQNPQTGYRQQQGQQQQSRGAGTQGVAMTKPMLDLRETLEDLAILQDELRANEDCWLLDTSRQDKIACQRDTQTIFLRVAATAQAPGIPNASIHPSRDSKVSSRFPRTMAWLAHFSTQLEGELGRAMLVRLKPSRPDLSPHRPGRLLPGPPPFPRHAQLSGRVLAGVRRRAMGDPHRANRLVRQQVPVRRREPERRVVGPDDRRHPPEGATTDPVPVQELRPDEGGG